LKENQEMALLNLRVNNLKTLCLKTQDHMTLFYCGMFNQVSVSIAKKHKMNMNRWCTHSSMPEALNLVDSNQLQKRRKSSLVSSISSRIRPRKRYSKITVS